MVHLRSVSWIISDLCDLFSISNNQETSLVIGEPLPMKKMTKAEKKELAARRFREPDTFRTFEKSISSYVQASLNLPKVNSLVDFH